MIYQLKMLLAVPLIPGGRGVLQSHSYIINMAYM